MFSVTLLISINFTFVLYKKNILENLCKSDQKKRKIQGKK